MKKAGATLRAGRPTTATARPTRPAANASDRSSVSARGKPRYVYRFGAGKADGRADMKQLLGGKGANLAEMTNLGVPVPPGLTITTEVCRLFYEAGHKWPAGLAQELEQGIYNSPAPQLYMIVKPMVVEQFRHIVMQHKI